MARARVFTAAMASVVAVALALGSSAALAAEGDEEEAPPANPTDVAIPYHAVFEAPMAEGWSVADCASLVAPEDITFTCEPDAMTFAAETYDPEFEPVAFPVTLLYAAESLTVTYTITQAPPELPAAAEAFAYPYPFAAGTRVLIPYSDLALLCQGCTEFGPTVEVLGTEPATAGSAVATASHLEVLPNPDFVGTITVGFTLEDPFEQVSEVGAVAISFYAPDTALTALHVVVAADEGVAQAVDLAALVTDASDDGFRILGCGAALHGTVVCTPDGTASYTPDLEWRGADQFSFHVFGDGGEQATGSVTIVDSARAEQLPLGLVRSTPMPEDGTIIPVALVDESETIASGLFSALQGVLDRVTGRVAPPLAPTDPNDEG